MSKLTLDALKERAEVTTSEELLESITGGNENACHDDNGVAFANFVMWLFYSH